MKLSPNFVYFPLARALFALAFLLGGLVAQEPAKDTSPHSSAELVSEFSTVVPGEAFTLGLAMKLDPEWHSYWVNPGDAGLGTKIKWSDIKGATISEVIYPTPHYIPTPPLASYGYENEVMLLLDAVAPKTWKPGDTVTLKGQADFLVCREVCLPAREAVSVTLKVGGEVEENSNWALAFARTRAAMPKPVSDAQGIFVRAAHADGGYLVALKSAAPSDLKSIPVDRVRFFAQDTGVIQHAGEQTRNLADGELVLFAPISEYSKAPAERLRGLLALPENASWKPGEAIHALAFDVPVESLGSIVMPAKPSSPGGGVPSSLFVILLSAFAGGMILNLMPCVFPVISLKIMNFVQQAGEDRGKIRSHGFVFAAGVLASFWALAGLLLALRAGGAQLGWGFQLQSPAFVAAMALLIFALGLSMAGVFEIGASLTRLGAAGGRSEGYGSSFFSGVLATVVATPCTAPFMGGALGYAISQPAWESMLVFTVLGAGMATPYVVLSLNPGLLKRLPRPGAWMETLKQVLSFPLFATVIWLVWVFGLQTGIDGATGLLAAMLFLGIAGWIVGRWNAYSISGPTRLATRILAALAIVAGLAFAWNASSYRAPAAAGSGSDAAVWQPWSPAKVEALVAEGKPVFVDFTAAWCLTCQVNKRVVLHRDAVERAFQDRNVTLLVADWTNNDPVIATQLEALNRSGVPVYALYKSGAKDPVLLPEILTEGIVMEALADLPAHAAVSQR